MFFRCALVKWSQTFLWLAAVKTRSIWLTVDDMGACCIQKHNKSSVVYLCLNWNSTVVLSSILFFFLLFFNSLSYTRVVILFFQHVIYIVIEFAPFPVNTVEILLLANLSRTLPASINPGSVSCVYRICTAMRISFSRRSHVDRAEWMCLVAHLS